MPSTNDLLQQALYQYQRGGATPSSLTALENYDPTAALQQYGAAAGGAFQTSLNTSLRDLQGRAASAGRLRTGFYDQDTGRLTTQLAQNYQNSLGQEAMNAASLKANTLGRAAGMQEDEQNRYLDLLSGQADRDQAAANARAQQNAGLFGGIGQLAGTLGGAAIMMSSERFKDDVAPIEGASDRLRRMPGVQFRWNDAAGPDREGQGDVGVLAEDVNQVLPEAVARDGQGRPAGVDYARIIPLLVEANREQQDEIDQLKMALRGPGSPSGGRPGMGVGRYLAPGSGAPTAYEGAAA